MVLPDSKGYFGDFGGRYVAEGLEAALEELENSYNKIAKSKGFQKELDYYLKNYVGRPTPLYFAKRLTEYVGGAKIYLKREDLCHTGAHKINNVLGQILLARSMGKTRIIAETGAGQHGVATATGAALFGLKCDVYMGSIDVERQRHNVFRMKLLGANVIPVEKGSKTLKDAINEALRDWVSNLDTTYYLLGSVAGPHPYPKIVRDFQSVIGKEVKKQIKQYEKSNPNYIVACVGGGSNAIGIFYPFFNDKTVRFIGVEGGGKGKGNLHAATLVYGKPGVLHGSYSYLLQDENGQVRETHSFAPGLDYPGVGPEHAYYRASGRAMYTAITDKEAFEAFKLLSEIEGIIPAFESAHAVAYAIRLAKEINKRHSIVVNLSGRGDKDMESAYKIINGEIKL